MIKANPLLVIFALLVSGCVTTSPPISPDSLGKYRDTLVDLNVKSNQALTAEYDRNFNNFKARVKNENQINPNPLTLRFCSGVFDWQWGDCPDDNSDNNETAQPAFNVIAKSRANLGELNQLMIDYANFLIQFNNANENTQANLAASAEKIGASAKSIASKFGSELNDAKLGAFGKIGANIMQQLLAKKQREGMSAVLADYQTGVNSFAELGSQAMVNSAIGINADYNVEQKKIARKIATEQDGTKRFMFVEQLLALNEQTASQLDSLRALSAAYKAIPSAYAELISAVKSGQDVSLKELVGHIETIAAIHKSLQATQTP